MSGFIALIALYLCIGSLIIFAFGNASQRGDEAADNLADRLLHGDVRLADLLNSFHDGDR